MVNLRRISCILLSAALLCCAFSAGGEETEQEASIYVLTGTGVERVPLETEEDTAGAENLSEHGIDLQDALEKLYGGAGSKLPASARLASPVPDWARKLIRLFDVTGDGCVDLCTCVTWGSGMVRTDLVVYDPLSDETYILDGYNYDYLIDRVEEDRLVIVMEGPHGYNDPITKTYGTVKVEDGRLVFTADPE